MNRPHPAAAPLETDMLPNDPLEWPIAALTEAYRRHAVSPVEVALLALARIERVQDAWRPFAHVDPAAALQAAGESEQRWWQGRPLGRLDGVPSTVKDLLNVQGQPTRRGSAAMADAGPAAEDSASVARLREGGAVLLGKTATPEFGWKGVTDSAITGVTRHPADLHRTPGGSSGGAAVAAALGLGHAHLATDGGGSIRIPAAFCGLFGFKPTFGLAPVHPHPPPWTLWHQGPLARRVADAACVLEAITRPDLRDFYAAPPLGLDFHRAATDGARDGAGLRGLRIGLSATLGYARPRPDVQAAFEQAAARLEALGAQVEDARLDLDDPIDIMAPLWEVAVALAVQGLPADRHALLEAPVREMAGRGAQELAVAWRGHEQRRAALAQRLARAQSPSGQGLDLLVTPQMPITAFEAGREVPQGQAEGRWWTWSPYTYPFNLTQQPAATVPCGRAADGLPVALQFVGRRFDDLTVLRAAAAWEAAHPFDPLWQVPQVGAAPRR